jgi:hypothetical protein
MRLSSVINAPKRLHYDGLITNSNNKMKTTWNIVKSVTNKIFGNKSIQSAFINGVPTENQQVIADFFQSHFLSVADKIVCSFKNDEDVRDINCIDYLYSIFKNTYPNIIFDCTMTKEIENIINSLKSKNS